MIAYSRLLILLVLLFGCMVPKGEVIHKSNYFAAPRLEVRLNGEAQSFGSGTVISCVPAPENKYKVIILTAKHLVYNYQDRLNEVTINAYFLGAPYVTFSKLHQHPNPGTDIMLLEGLSDFFIAPVAIDLGTPRLGARILTISWPYGYGPSTIEGYLADREMSDGQVLWLCSAGIFFGSSGGMVVDAMSGKLIGVIVEIRSTPDHKFIIPNVSYFVGVNQFYDWLRSYL